MIYLLVATWLASCSQNYDITEELSEALPGNANVSASDYNVSQDDIAKLLTLNYGIIPNWGWDGRDENVKYSLSPGWMGGNNNYRYKVETIIDFTKK